LAVHLAGGPTGPPDKCQAAQSAPVVGSKSRDELGRLVAWHLPGGPVGPPAGGPPCEMSKKGVEQRRGPKLGKKCCLDKLFAGASEFLVTPPLMGPIYQSQGRFEEPVCPLVQTIYLSVNSRRYSPKT